MDLIDNINSNGKITLYKVNHGIEQANHSFFSEILLAKLFY